LGLSTYFREKNPAVQIVAVDPLPESRVSLDKPDTNIIDGVVPITKVPAAALPPLFEDGLYDEVISVKTEDAYVVARELAQNDGILVGTSAASATLAATQVAQRPQNAGKNIVVIMPDDGMKYLTTQMYPKP
jgi:cysteine synthase A